MLIAYGTEVKSLNDTGRIGGYLVRFRGPHQPDLTGDFFTPHTDFGFHTKTNILYHHGLDRVVGKRSLGTGEITQDEVGLWIEAQLDLRDRYERAIWDMVKSGRLSWSSGTAPHLVERRSHGKSSEITRWPVGLDASLTIAPADPYNDNTVLPIKSLPLSRSFESEKPMNDEITRGDVVEIIQEHLAPILKEVKAALQAPAPIKTGVFLPGDTANDTPDIYRDPLARKFFDSYLRGNIQDIPEEIKAYGLEIKEGMRRDDPTLGGYLVPTDQRMEFIKELEEGSIMRSVGARVLKLSGTDRVTFPKLTKSGRAVKTAEAGTFARMNPTLAQIAFTPYKYTRETLLTTEVVQHTKIDIMSLINPDFMLSFTQAENEDFTIGTGAGEPEGILTGASVYDINTATNPTAEQMIDFYHSMNHLYRSRAKWMMNDAILKGLRKLKDTTGQFLWQPGLQAGAPDKFLGHDVIINEFMPSTVAADTKIIVFADFAYFWIGDWESSSIEVNDIYKSTGQIGYLMHRKYDSHVVLDEAVKVLQI